MILLWVVIGVGIYYLAKNNGWTAPSLMPNDKRAEDILKQRYVNGEIDDETYKRMFETIRK